MSFWGRIFGTEAALKSAVDGVKNGLDALVYTDEEKANDAAKDRTEARQMVVGWMQATQGQNLARRVIALSVTFVWLLQYITYIVIGTVNIFYSSPQVQNAARFMKDGATDMNGAVMLILTFYFAAPHMGEVIGKITGNMKSKL